MAEGGNTDDNYLNMPRADEYIKEISNVSSRMNIVDRQLIDYDQKYSALASTVIRLSKSYNTMYSTVMDLQKRSMSNNVLLSNISDYSHGSLIESCRQKLIEMGVDPEKTDIERAHRTGPSLNHKPRQVVARLHRQDHAQHILEVTKSLRNEPYNPYATMVTPQIPTSLKHARTRAYDIADTARQQEPYADIYVLGEKVYKDNIPIKDLIEPQV
jgi:hypothetical protein